MRVEHSLGVFAADGIVAENQAHLVPAIRNDGTWRHSGLTITIRVMAGDVRCTIVKLLPSETNHIADFHDGIAIARHHTYGGTRPVEDLNHGI